MSPTERLLALVRKQGWTAEVVERWVPAASGGFRRDLFKFIDIIAFGNGSIAGFQVTDANSFRKHLDKYEDPDILHRIEGWLASGGLFFVVGVKKATKTLPLRYQCTAYTLDDTGAVQVHTPQLIRRPVFLPHGVDSLDA